MEALGALLAVAQTTGDPVIVNKVEYVKVPKRTKKGAQKYRYIPFDRIVAAGIDAISVIRLDIENGLLVGKTKFHDIVDPLEQYGIPEDAEGPWSDSVCTIPASDAAALMNQRASESRKEAQQKRPEPNQHIKASSFTVTPGWM
jgi:hypothetical protein